MIEPDFPNQKKVSVLKCICKSIQNNRQLFEMQSYFETAFSPD